MSPTVEDDDGEANRHMVFIDTSLDTHLALTVSDSDTVSDLKRNIMLEHRQLFPATGDVKIECLKVKRRGSFYHLSESMLVKSAFVAAKGNWFVSVDASRLEQNDGSQQLGEHKDVDQLALPWVTHSRSIERHDKDGSPSVHSKTAPLVNQKVPIVDQLTSGDSWKDVSKNAVEDRLCNDKQLDYELQEKLDTVNTDINLKKRTRDVHNEGSLNDAFGSGPSVKKKRKTQRGKSDVKALEENLALRHDGHKVNDKGANMNNDNFFEHRSKCKDLSDEYKRINKGESCSALDQVATVVPTIEGVGSETVSDVAMVVENNIQQEMAIGRSQKDKDSELVQKPATEGEIPSSLMRTPDCEHGGAGVTDMGHMKRATKHKAAEKEASSISSIKKLHNTNKDAIESSLQQDVGTNGHGSAGDQIDKYKDNLKTSLKQKPELKLPEGRTGIIVCESISEDKRRKTKKRFKRNDNLVGDISSTVLASVTDERKMDEVSEKTLIDAKEGDGVIVKEVDISVEYMEENSKKEFADTNDVTNEEILLPRSESPVNNDADILTTGKNTSQVNAQGLLDNNLERQDEKMDDTPKKKKKRKTKVSAGRNEDESITKHANLDACDNLEKQDEKMDDTTKKKKKRRIKASAGRNEDESITKHVNRDICENVKEGESGLPDTDRTDGDMSSTVLASVIDVRKMNENLEKTLIDGKNGDYVITKEVEISVENKEEESRKEFTNANDVVTGTNEEILLPCSESPVNNDADISTTGKNTSQVNAQFLLEKQDEKMDDTTKKKKKRKTKVSTGRNEDDSVTKHANPDTCDNLEKQDEKMDDATKKKKKRKTKVSAGRNEDESITKDVNRDICKNVKEGESGLPDTDRTDGDMSSTVLASVIDERKMNEDMEKTLIDGKKGDDVIVKEVEVSVENMEEKSRKEVIKANDVVTGRNEENLLLLASAVDEREMNEGLEKMLIDGKKGDDAIVKEVEVSVDNMEEKSRKEFTNANDVVTVTNEENLLLHSESLMSNDTEISTRKNTSQVNAQGMLDNSERQNEKTDDTTKKKKKKKTKKSAARNEDESVTKNVNGDICENVKEGGRKDGDKVKEKDAQISNDGLAGKENKNSKSQDLQVELESKKSQSFDHHHVPEKTLKNVTASEVAKVNNEVDIPESESRELDSKDHFAPDQPKKTVSIDNKKEIKKTKFDSRNDQTQKPVSKIENKVSADVGKFKNPKRAKKVDAQKNSRQQSTLVQARAKTVENKKLNGSQPVKSLLNRPGTIFGNDSDSDSSTHTPSGKSSSSSSSSEEENSFSLYSRRNRSHARQGMEGAGKDNINSQNKSKDPLMGKLLRSSSAFKKAKVYASSQGEDTAEFVRESQP